MATASLSSDRNLQGHSRSRLSAITRARAMERAVPWSELPVELWSTIGKKLDTPMDVNRFRSVCSSWRSLIPPVSEFTVTIEGDSTDQCRLYLLEPPPTSPKDSRGPPPREGWLIKVAEVEDESGRRKVRLLNPLSSRPILFKGETFPKILCPLDYRVTEIFVERFLRDEVEGSYPEGIRKVIMLPDSPRAVREKALVVWMYVDGELVCGEQGDEKWKEIGDPNCQYEDLIAYKGQLYVVNGFGIVWRIDPSLKAVQFSPSVRSDGSSGDQKYLVESGGDLYVVDRYFSEESRVIGSRIFSKAADFKVYRLNQEWGKWDEITDLGDVALFLGEHSCFSMPVRGLGGCKGNCIYFTEIEAAQVGEVHVFDMEDRSMKPCSPDQLGILWPPPAWIAPKMGSP